MKPRFLQEFLVWFNPPFMVWLVIFKIKNYKIDFFRKVILALGHEYYTQKGQFGDAFSFIRNAVNM